MLEPLFLFPVFQALPVVFQGSIETMRDTQSPSVCADSVSFRFPAVDRIIWQNNAAGNMFHSADNGPPVPLLCFHPKEESRFRFSSVNICRPAKAGSISGGKFARRSSGGACGIFPHTGQRKDGRIIRRHVPAIVLHNDLAHFFDTMFSAMYSSAFPGRTS